MDAYITDNILSKKKFEIVDCIKAQEIQNKEAFDDLFKDTVARLSHLKKLSSVNVWARTQILTNFEILNRIHVWKYWIDVELERLNHIVEHKIILKAQHKALRD